MLYTEKFDLQDYSGFCKFSHILLTRVHNFIGGGEYPTLYSSQTHCAKL